MIRLLILLLFLNVAQANIVYEFNKDDLPIEMQYMLKNLSTYNLENDEKQVLEINELIKELNSHLSKYKKGENYFFIKTECYKAIYELSPGQRFKSNQLTFSSESLQRKYGKVKNQFPFIYWMIIGLINDYKSFKADNSTNASLATPWLNYFNENDPEETSIQIQNLILGIIQRITAKYEFYSVAFDEKEEGAKPIKIMKKEKGKDSVPIENIAEKIIKKAKRNFEESFDYKSLTLSELFPEPDPTYSPPSDLPKPVQDYSKE